MRTDLGKGGPIWVNEDQNATWVNKSEEWTESFTDNHPTKPHPAPGDTCQDEWQKLS